MATDWQAELDEALDALTDNPYSDVAVQRIRDLFARLTRERDRAIWERNDISKKAVALTDDLVWQRAEVREMLIEACGHCGDLPSERIRQADAILKAHGYGGEHGD